MLADIHEVNVMRADEIVCCPVCGCVRMAGIGLYVSRKENGMLIARLGDAGFFLCSSCGHEWWERA